MIRTYCYEGPDGVLVEHTFEAGKAPESVECHGVVYTRCYQAELSSQYASVRGSSNRVKRTYPMTCYASGVHADQAQDLRDHLSSHGVPTEVTTDGDPIYTSAAHRRKALKVRGLIDKSSFC